MTMEFLIRALAEGFSWNKRNTNSRPNLRPSSSVQDVARIVTELETLQARGSRFDTALRRWQSQRRETIETVDELRQKLETVSVCANVARGAGSAAIIAGGLASLIGAIMEMNDKEGSDQWLDAGAGLKKLGEMTVPTATLLEYGVSEMFMNRVKTVLQRDLEYSEPLNEWMRLSRNLDTHVQQTFGCSLTSDICSNVLSAFSTSLKMLKSGRTSDAYRNIKSSGSMSSYQKFNQLAEGIGDVSLSSVLDLVQKVSSFIAYSPNTLQFCQSGAELAAAMYGQPSRMGAMATMAAVECGLSELNLNPQQRRCGLEVARITSEVVNMVFNAKNITENQSQYCEQLDELKSKLKEELVEVSRASRR